MLRWLAVIGLLVGPARAEAQCHVVDVELTPSDASLQIVGWIEKADGTFVDTIYITRKTGSYGLGNRPGRFDFNSGPPGNDMWPYGRRTSVFPVWAHRHGKTWPAVVFQDGGENDLSHNNMQSSHEEMPPYCRPSQPDMHDAVWDTLTCASLVFTDKGTLSPTETSLYPPRTDLTRVIGVDAPSVDMFRALNPFDAVSQATPPAGTDMHVSWAIPPGLQPGDYVVWLEVSKAFDMNASYNATTLPPPCGAGVMPCTPPTIAYAYYGQPYLGQPSVVYKVPFTLAQTETMAASQAYVGYGAPDGADGAVRPPDATITTAAQRLMMIAGSSDVVRVDARPENDTTAPGAASDLAAANVTASSATIQFLAPGNDGAIGMATAYEIRYLANAELTEANFDQGHKIAVFVPPAPAGTPLAFDLTGLLPETDYWVGIRAVDACRNRGRIAIMKLTTSDRQTGEVGACFIATAAYGSAMANDVVKLRRFRDEMLRTSVLGELATEAYYTFGPGVAGMVGESDLLRHVVRDLLAPIVSAVR